MKINYFEKRKIFYHFMILSRKFLTECRKFFGGFVKTAFLVSMGTFFNFLKNLCFSYHFRTFDEKKFGFMSENFSRGCQNGFPFFTETFRRKVLSRKNKWVFLSVSENHKIFGFSPKKLDRAVKTAFCLSIGQFWGKKFLGNYFGLFIIFGLRATFFNLLSNIF